MNIVLGEDLLERSFKLEERDITTTITVKMMHHFLYTPQFHNQHLPQRVLRTLRILSESSIDVL